MTRRMIGTLMVLAVIAAGLIRVAAGSEAPTPDTCLLLKGRLVDAQTRQPLRNATVMIAGSGLPPRARSDGYGTVSVPSSSAAGQIQVTLTVAGYKPYRLAVIRQERVTNCIQCIEPVYGWGIALTPLPRAPRARVG